MRILLYSANTYTEPYPVYPLGLACIAAALEQAGHTVVQVDVQACAPSSAVLQSEPSSASKMADIHAALRNSLVAEQPDAVGISIRNIDNVDSLCTGTQWTLDGIKEAVRIVRSLTRAPIIFGGAGFSLMPEAILDYCSADYGIVGEGETAFPLLLSQLEQKQSPPRLQRSAQPLVGKELLAAQYSPPILQYYLEQSGIANIQTKRGCPHRCMYCSYPQLEGKRIRARDPEAVLDDIRRLQRDYSVQELFFADSVFNDVEGKWLLLVEAMLRNNIRIPWTGFFQPAGLTVEQLRMCKQTGLKAIEFGTDACSDTTLHAMGKHFGFSSAAAMTQLCNAERMPCAHFVIVGGPQETEQTLAEGLHNLATLKHCLVFAFLGVRILPSTPLFQYAVQEGSLAPNTSCLQPTFYFSPHITQNAAEQQLLQGFKSNRQRIFPPAVGNEKNQVLRQLGYRGILWDSLIRFPV